MPGTTRVQQRLILRERPASPIYSSAIYARFARARRANAAAEFRKCEERNQKKKKKKSRNELRGGAETGLHADARLFARRTYFRWGS